MYKIDKLTLIAGADIKVREIGVKIHQPNIYEIALLGEERFFQALNIFFLNAQHIRETLRAKSEAELGDLIKDLDDFMLIILITKLDPEIEILFHEIMGSMFPDYEIRIDTENLILELKDSENNLSYIDNESFIVLKEIVEQIFSLDKLIDKTGMNPQNEKAKKIAEKIQRSRERVKAQQQKTDRSVFSYYISILSIGSNALNIKDLCSLTIYQLYEQFERFGLYSQYEQSVKAALAGAKVEIVDWLKEI